MFVFFQVVLFFQAGYLPKNQLGNKMSNQNTLHCKYKGLCGGCSWWHLSAQDQMHLKAQTAQDLWWKTFNENLEMETHQAFVTEGRDRIDLTWTDQSWGMFSLQEKKLIPLALCVLSVPDLQKAHQDFIQIPLPEKIKKASCRLRVSPSGDRGLWLDMANLDIKYLLEESNYLMRLTEKNFQIEMGQKRKKVVLTPQKWSLQDPAPSAWSVTYFQDQSLPLYGSVGSFTQSGPAAVRCISKILKEFIQTSDPSMLRKKSCAEFGAGLGTLTAMTLPFFDEFHIYEWDLPTINLLQTNLKKWPITTRTKVEFFHGDFRHQSLGKMYYDTLLLNPARSGLGHFLKDLPTEKPRQIIYMSCFFESFLKDAKILREQGYILKKAHLVDQFPFSPHFEFLSLWQQASTETGRR